MNDQRLGGEQQERVSPMANEKTQNVQDVFLNHIRKNKIPVTIFLINGVKLQGVVSSFDNFCLLLRRDGHVQLVYKHAVSTVMPAAVVRLYEPSAEEAALPPPDREATPRPFPVAAAPTRTLVLCPAAPPERRDGRAEHGRLAEAVGLAQAIDLHVVAAENVPLRTPRPATLFGSGRVQTTAAMVAAEHIDLVVVDARLSAVQQRNLERAWSCKVIDRTGLILEIFGERARTREGRLQVELAALTYQRSRLVRSWTHLERQRGGFGFLGGPGESQIELDRRRIDDRITHIQRELEAVKLHPRLHRAARDRAAYPVIALVGYTNAGKSTLFNCLTGANVGARDQLFATLDPTMRLLTLPSGQEAICRTPSVLSPICRPT